MKAKRGLIIAGGLLVGLVAAGFWLLTVRGTTDIAVPDSVERLAVYSSAFEDLGAMPDAYTGRGDDISPDFRFDNLS